MLTFVVDECGSTYRRSSTAGILSERMGETQSEKKEASWDEILRTV